MPLCTKSRHIESIMMWNLVCSSRYSKDAMIYFSSVSYIIIVLGIFYPKPYLLSKV